MRSELWWHLRGIRQRESDKREWEGRTTKAKEITPIASKTPGRTNDQRSEGSPFKLSSTPGPRTPTLMTMMTML